MSSALTDWYFSEEGGLLLTPQARNFYFALQDLLQTTSKIPYELHVNRSIEAEGDQKENFRAILKQLNIDDAMTVFDYFSTDNIGNWQDIAANLGVQWSRGVKKLAAGWRELDERQRFAVLQQAGSILRLSLINDLESRLR